MKKYQYENISICSHTQREISGKFFTDNRVDFGR